MREKGGEGIRGRREEVGRDMGGEGRRGRKGGAEGRQDARPSNPQDNESFVIQGAQKIADYSGYGLDLKFRELISVEKCSEIADPKIWRERFIVAIDALPFPEGDPFEVLDPSSFLVLGLLDSILVLLASHPNRPPCFSS
jgi:hypothetical protein